MDPTAPTFSPASASLIPTLIAPDPLTGLHGLTRLVVQIDTMDPYKVRRLRIEFKRKNLHFAQTWTIPLYAQGRTSVICVKYNHAKGQGCPLGVTCRHPHVCVVCGSPTHGAFFRSEPLDDENAAEFGWICPEVSAIYEGVASELRKMGLPCTQADMDSFVAEVMRGKNDDDLDINADMETEGSLLNFPLDGSGGGGRSGSLSEQDQPWDFRMDDDEPSESQQASSLAPSYNHNNNNNNSALNSAALGMVGGADPVEWVSHTTAEERDAFSNRDMRILATALVEKYRDEYARLLKPGDQNPQGSLFLRLFNNYPAHLGRDQLHVPVKAPDSLEGQLNKKWRKRLASAVATEFFREVKALGKVTPSGALPLGIPASSVVPLTTKPGLVTTPPPTAFELELSLLLGSPSPELRATLAGAILDESYVSKLIDCGELGYARAIAGPHAWRRVYLNTHEPFCFLLCGAQGSGKSHTLGVLLENCLVPFWAPTPSPPTRPPIVKLGRPMTVLTLHYDQSPRNALCEAIGLSAPSPTLQALLGTNGIVPPHLPPSSVVVLVSSAFYAQRNLHYKTMGPAGIRVLPLLMSFSTLTSQQLKILMRLEGDQEAHMLETLRRYQRENAAPGFTQFASEMNQIDGFSATQMRLLESVVMEAPVNSRFAHLGVDVSRVFRPGVLVAVDLSDPLLSPIEAGAIFQVVVDKFRGSDVRGGKLLMVDDADKLLGTTASNASGEDGLGKALVSCARTMRHDGMRVAVAVTNPLALHGELLELSTVAMFHRFSSPQWFNHVKERVPLPSGTMEEIKDLEDGEAIVFGRIGAGEHRNPALGVQRVKMRGRFTVDLGGGRVNV